MQTYHLTPGQGTDLMDKVLSIPLISFCSLSSRMWTNCSQVSIPQTNTPRGPLVIIYLICFQSVANIAFIKYGNKFGNAKSSRSGCQETFSWHFQNSGHSHDKWKALRRSQSTRESGSIGGFQAWTGVSPLVRWDERNQQEPKVKLPHQGEARSLPIAKGLHQCGPQKFIRREREKKKIGDWSGTYFSHWEGKEAGGLYCELSNFSNQVIPADRAPSLLRKLPCSTAYLCTLTETLSVQFPPQPLLSVGAYSTSVYLTRTQFRISGTLAG